MGLDMYLEKRIYIGANYEHRNIKGTIDIKQDKKKIKINFDKISEITEQAGYWRKANAIHNWFVQNVQEGNDNCADYYVSQKQLKELKDLCEKVIKSLKKSKTKTIKVESGWANGKKTFINEKVFLDTTLADKLLPTQEGFFFGSTDCNKWYLEELENTVEILDEAIKDETSSFYYSSSW